MLKLLKLSIFSFLLLFVFVFTQSAWAVEDTSTTESNSVKQTNINDRVKNVKEKVEVNKEERQAKLSEARMRLCEARADKISSRFNNLLSLGTRSHQSIDSKLNRVDYFYNNVLVPKGFELENYDDLKADIATNKAEVSTLLANARENGQSFSCDSDDPRGQADTFRADMQVLIAAVKEYRASVRIFIVAVRDLAKESKADTLIKSPEVSPEVTEIPAQ